MANHAIHPVARATTQPEARPLMSEPMKAERMAEKALAAGPHLGVMLHWSRSRGSLGAVLCFISPGVTRQT